MYTLLCRYKPSRRKALTTSSVEMTGRMIVEREVEERIKLMMFPTGPGIVMVGVVSASQNTNIVQRILRNTRIHWTAVVTGKKHSVCIVCSVICQLSRSYCVSMLCDLPTVVEDNMLFLFAY